MFELTRSVELDLYFMQLQPDADGMRSARGSGPGRKTPGQGKVHVSA